MQGESCGVWGVSGVQGEGRGAQGEVGHGDAGDAAEQSRSASGLLTSLLTSRGVLGGLPAAPAPLCVHEAGQQAHELVLEDALWFLCSLCSSSELRAVPAP